MTTSGLPRWQVLRFFFDPRFRADPYPLYARLRESTPVLHAPLAVTLVARYDDAMTAVADRRLSSSEAHADYRYRAGRDGAGLLVEAPVRFLMHRGGADPDKPFNRIARHFLIAIDDPEHGRLRRLVSRAFTPRVVTAARPDIEKIAAELLDGMERRGRAELMSEYAYQLPVRVICHLLGVPADDFPRFRGWVVDIVSRFDVADLGSKKMQARADAAATQIDRYVRGLAERRRAEPSDDLLSALVHAVDDGDRLDEEELVSVVVLLLAAGHETTANLIGNSVWHLSRHPDQIARWKEEPDLRSNGIEELLRYDSPIQMVQRIALDDMTIDGVDIPRGRLVIPLLGAANRDPARFPDPDRLDLGRPDCQPASFGFGPHHCIGATLARVEGEVGLAALYERLPRVRPAVAKPAWRRSIIFRGLAELPVTWG